MQLNNMFLIYKIRLMCVRTSLMHRHHVLTDCELAGQKNRVMAQRVKVDLVRFYLLFI